MRARLAGALVVLSGAIAAPFACGGSSVGGPPPGGGDAHGADGREALGADARDAKIGRNDAAGDVAPDRDGGPFVPTSVRAELVSTSPSRVLTPPAWNEHSPKLVGDGSYLYAVHTYFTDTVDTRVATLLRRPRAPAIGSGTWTVVATLSYPHQPPGLVIDTSLQMHMVFDCLRPGSSDVTCFQGGAGTGGLTSRFYHLVFGARDGSGALRFDTYANANEWTAESNGYTGIGTTADGVTWWSLADSTWERVVQWAGGSQQGTVATLTAPNAYLLYPIHAAHPVLGSKELVLYAGEFDPDGGNNASYLASTAYSGDVMGLSLLFRRAPAMPVPGTIAAYPSDIAFDAAGTLYALSYLPTDAGRCTELLRFDGGLGAPPTILPVGCVSDYATLHFSHSGALYLLTDASGATVTMGVSGDRGQRWTWATIPIVGVPSNGDTQFHGFTPVKPYTSPALFASDKLLFFFYGADASGGVENSYVGEIDLGG